VIVPAWTAFSAVFGRAIVASLISIGVLVVASLGVMVVAGAAMAIVMIGPGSSPLAGPPSEFFVVIGVCYFVLFLVWTWTQLYGGMLIAKLVRAQLVGRVLTVSEAFSGSIKQSLRALVPFVVVSFVAFTFLAGAWHRRSPRSAPGTADGSSA